MKAYDGSLFRGLTSPPETRAEGEGDSTYLQGHFAIFNAWTEIDSYYEGRFLEMLAPGAFKKTIKDSARDGGGSKVICQFDHGYDTHIGDMPLGPFDELREDDIGVFYGVPLLDTDYNRDRILPLLLGRTMDGGTHGSLLGASFRFRVIGERWNDEPGASEHNPMGLPERIIEEVRLFEGGPVVFPAYDEATAGIRSVCLTDHYERRAQEARSKFSPAAPRTDDTPPDEPPAEHSPVRSLSIERESQLHLERSFR